MTIAWRFWSALLPAAGLCALAAAGGARTATAELPRQVRVLSYNIHHGEGADGRLDLQRIADVINAAQADVAALQEVDQGTARTERIDMPAELARLTNMQAVFGRNIDHDGGGYGTAVLTRLPIKSNELHRLPSHTVGEQRGVQAVELGDASDYFLLLATHLDYRPDDGERMASVRKIESLAASAGTAPMILVGDLNAHTDSRVMRELERRWKRANDDELPTFPAAEPTKQIDFVLVRPAARWKTIEARVLKEPVASDHSPLLVVLERVD